jgi:hypothetical protein
MLRVLLRDLGQKLTQRADNSIELGCRRRMSLVLSNDRWCPDLRHDPTNQQGGRAAQNNFHSTRCRVFQYAGSNNKCYSDRRFPPTYRQLDRIGADDDSCRQCQRKHPAFRTSKEQKDHPVAQPMTVLRIRDWKAAQAASTRGSVTTISEMTAHNDRRHQCFLCSFNQVNAASVSFRCPPSKIVSLAWPDCLRNSTGRFPYGG